MSVILSFAGDFVSDNPKNITMSEDLRCILDESDINVCNFEAPIAGVGEISHRSGPKLCQSSESYSFLKKQGFSLFQMANNHAADYGEEACLATKNLLEETVGVGTEEEAYSPIIKEIDGIKIGFLSFTHHEFGTFDDGTPELEIGTAWICSHKTINAIISTKRIVDYLIILPHAGVEQVDFPLPEWRSLYRSFVDYGADAVIGTHPHVPQGWETYKGKPIFYSLGNFYFDSIMPSEEWWYKGLLVSLVIDESGLRYVVYNTDFCEGVINLDESTLTKQHNSYLCEVLNDEQRYLDCVNQMVLEKWNELKVYYVRGIGAISFRLPFMEFLKSVYCALFRKPNSSLLINALQCESHRYVALRAQKLLNKN